MNKTSVTIGIPAFNEEANIKNLLLAVLEQKGDFVIDNILVFSDGSTDATITEARSISDHRIKVFDDPVRRGAMYRQNQILDIFSGEVLVILNADIMLANDQFLTHITQPILDNPNVGLVGANYQSLPGDNLFENIINFSSKLKEEIYLNINNGNNIYMCRGVARAFSSKFAKKFRFKDAVSEDAYSYIECLRSGFIFFFASKAIVFYKSPQNLNDHMHQSIRFIQGKKDLHKYSDGVIVDNYFKIPLNVYIKVLFKYLFINPLYFLSYVVIFMVSAIFSMISQRAELKWQVATSSKKLGEKQAFAFDKPGVTVAVSAYNEKNNIGNFITSVLSQSQNNFVLDKILIILDGCTDSTIDVIKSFDSNLIETRNYNIREGKSTRLNDIYSTLNSDILIQSDADVILSNDKVISSLVNAFLMDADVMMCGGHPVPIQGLTFVERAVNITFNVYDKFRKIIRGGSNIFSADGRLLAFRKDFAKTLIIPSTMIANDAYAYFCCKTKGLKYLYVESAVVNYRSPQNLKDQIKQNTRFIAAHDRMSKYFSPELVSYEYSVPRVLLIINIFGQAIRHPLLSFYIFTVNIYCHVNAYLCESRLNSKWDMAISTKRLS